MTDRHEELLVRARRADQARRSFGGSRYVECRYCSTRYRFHPGFSDHQDKCPLNPLNREHIVGTAVAAFTPTVSRLLKRRWRSAGGEQA